MTSAVAAAGAGAIPATQSGSLVVLNSNFGTAAGGNGNQAFQGGGAVYFHTSPAGIGGPGSLFVSNSNFFGNSVLNTNAGGHPGPTPWAAPSTTPTPAPVRR